MYIAVCLEPSQLMWCAPATVRGEVKDRCYFFCYTFFSHFIFNTFLLQKHGALKDMQHWYIQHFISHINMKWMNILERLHFVVATGTPCLPHCYRINCQPHSVLRLADAEPCFWEVAHRCTVIIVYTVLLYTLNRKHRPPLGPPKMFHTMADTTMYQ